MIGRASILAVIWMLLDVGSAAGQSVPRFQVEAHPIQLDGPARDHAYLGDVGREAGYFGRETGTFEAWSWPLKILHDFQLAFEVPDYSEPIPGRTIARHVIVRPEATTIVYSHASFTVRQHFVVPLHEPGLLLLLEVDAVAPLELVASFRADLNLMWPGGFGGQYAYWDAAGSRFLLSESRRAYNAYVGSPWASDGSSHPAHATPDAPSVFRIPVDTARARSEFIPIAVVAGHMERDSLSATYTRLIENAEEYYSERVEHARRISRQATIRTPESELDLALEWAKVNLDQARACNPDLGCGLVAGYGPSGRSRRPGFGWYFGGDASINALGILTYGGFELARAGLEFQRRYRRADGKMPHEVSQSALRTREDWFEDFPYAYYHADTTPYWVVALHRYWLQTADTTFVRESWRAVVDAYRWGLAHDSDDDGIVDNTAAGLGAVEVGGLGTDLHQDIYLAAIWVESLRGVADLARALEDSVLAAEAAANHARARDALERRYFVAGPDIYAFGLLKGGKTNPAVTVWPATALSFELLDRERAAATLDALASSRLSTDWGVRMLASDHAYYAPLHYNNGAVWPFVTGFASWAAYRYHRAHAGFAALRANAASTFFDARGRNPELMSGAFHRTLDTTVPQQFFASSMIPTPLFRGLFGLRADAPRGRLALEPHLPADWPFAEVRRYPIGTGRVDVVLRREPEGEVGGSSDTSRLTAALRSSGDRPLTIRYAPALPPGSRVLGVRVNERPADFQLESTDDDVHPAVELELVDEATVTVSYESGVSVIAPHLDSPIGAESIGLRIIRYRYHRESGQYVLNLEGRGGHRYSLDVISPRGRPTEVTGGTIQSSTDRGAFRLELAFPSTGQTFLQNEVRFRPPPP